MCGIAGIIGTDPDLRTSMARMLHALRHRGPDGEGEMHGPGAIFGHRRLSIIDLEGGRQPLATAACGRSETSREGGRAERKRRVLDLEGCQCWLRPRLARFRAWWP